jgi:FtsH-binding integral membrane protein
MNTTSEVHVKSDLENESKDINMAGAFGLGIVASIVGGIIWYYVSVLTNMEFGYVAIGLGYLIAFSVYIGAGKKRARNLQILALVLTLVTIFFVEHVLYVHFANEYIQTHLSDFPNFQAGDRVGIPLFDQDFLSSLVTPIGLVIYAVGAYVAYKYLRPKMA